MARLPYTLRILLENVLRNGSEAEVEAVRTGAAADEPCARDLVHAGARAPRRTSPAFPRSSTSPPCATPSEQGGDPGRINPLIPAELVIDHSVQVDEFATRRDEHNVELEFERNRERYAFLRWGQSAFDTFKVCPAEHGALPPGDRE